MQWHLSDRAIEEYSLEKLAEASLAVVEEHLLVCDHCRDRLAGIETVNYVHDTEDGSVYARITKLTTGRVMARQWGSDLHAGRAFGNFGAAKRYLSESFTRMYPEHTCLGACGSPRFRGEPDWQLNLKGHSAALRMDSFCERILRDLAQMGHGIEPPAA